RMDYTAIGDTTNVTSRLQNAAEPGQIVISEATHRLVEGYCTTQPLDALVLKGKTEPMRAWNVLTVQETRTRLEVEAERGLTSFVGREREFQLLTDCFAQAQEGHGQIMFLVGEAGLGKSRLLLEFRHRIGTDATWLEGHAMSFGRSMAFHPLIDMLRRNVGIEEDDPENVIIEKIDQHVLRLDAALQPILPYLRYLLAVDPGDPMVQALDPQLRRAELFDALRRLLLRAAEVRPQVLVFEDLQWMDKATEAFVAFLADSIPTSRVLCLFTHRSDYRHPFGERTYHTRMSLPTLSAADTVQIAQAMLTTEHLPDELATLIVQKAEGNPFFVEEVVKSLRETGVLRQEGDRYILTKPLDDIIVPDTIQDVLMARIDRLEDAPKRTLQLASVVGREFTYRLLDRLTDIRQRTEACLQELKAIELIYEKSLFPELLFMFKHALTQDVAYNSLLEQQRKDLHGTIARAIEELYADRLPEHYDMLAYHFARGEAWPKALEYLLKAAQKAAQAFAPREALSLYDQVLAVLDRLDPTAPVETRMTTLKARAGLQFALGDFASAEREWQHLVEVARQANDRASEGAALAGASSATMWAQDFDRALAYASQAIEIGEQTTAPAALAGGIGTTAYIYAVTSRLDEARPLVDRALTLSRSAGDVAQQTMALFFSGFMDNWQGAYDTGTALLGEGVEIARQHNLLGNLIRCLWAQGVTLVGKGNYDQAQQILTEASDLADKIGDEAMAPRILNTLGWLFIECQDFERGIAYNARGAERARLR
ncbi:MAG: AAA family ATPase, partial [Candidatus Tectomicrobia bacterium]